MLDFHRILERIGINIGVEDEPVKWKCLYRLEKRYGNWNQEQIDAGLAPDPYEILEGEGNLLTTTGAGQLWSGLATAGLATPFNSTNAQIAVGNASTAATAADTDMGATAGANMNSGDISGATNASPIVLTVPSWTTTPVVGQVVVVAGVLGNTAANGTFEVSAVTATTVTLLNSTGNGAFATSAGSTVKLINKYRQTVSGAPTLSTNQAQFVSTFATANANHAWNEWGITTGGGATNKQASAPPTLLNHAVPGGGLGTKTSAASWTMTATLSLS